jgi:hypothetical protein
VVRRKHSLKELLDDKDTLLRLVNGETNLADLKLGENHITLHTYRTIVKVVKRVAKHLAPLKTSGYDDCIFFLIFSLFCRLRVR